MGKFPASLQQGHGEQFRRKAAETATLRELTSLFADEMKPFGVTGFAVGHLSGGGRPVTMFMATWPRGLLEAYAINAFIKDDPIVLGAIASAEPFTWAEAGVGPGFADDKVVSAFQRYGFEQGFAVPIHGPGDARGVVALLASRLLMSPSTRPLVVDMARSGYAIARRLHDRQAGPVKLPPREREALALVSHGFEDAAIGAALGITRTSAHVYVERAKRRLGATTRAQAVAIAIADGLL